MTLEKISVQTKPVEYRDYIYIVFCKQATFWYRIVRDGHRPFLISVGGYLSIEEAAAKAKAMIDAIWEDGKR
jgi:hypothetical protein